MARNFPYFKFIATDWLTGNIAFESLEVQGLFINICALYWQRDGELKLDDVIRRYKNEKLIAELTERFISVNDGFISIDFLDEQLTEANHISRTNSENGKKGGRPQSSETLEKKPSALISVNETEAKLSKEKKRKEKERKEKEIKEELEQRKLKFADTLKEYIPKYGREMLLDFYDYWTEPNKSHSKFRKEMQATWELSRRLKTWSDYNKKFTNGNSNKQNSTGYDPDALNKLNSAINQRNKQP